MAEKKIIEITEEGYAAVLAEYNNLKDVLIPANIQALQDARSQGDLSENADYDAARDEQAQVESRIKELEYKIEHCEIIENKKKSNVSLGSKVVIAYDDGEEEEYMIVGSLEADPFNNRISNESPIGIAVMGKKQGETASVESPNGSYTITIKEIK